MGRKGTLLKVTRDGEERKGVPAAMIEKKLRGSIPIPGERK